MNSLNVGNEKASNSMEENLQAFPYFRQNLHKYLLQITVHNNENSQWGNISRFDSLEEHLKDFLGKVQSDQRDETFPFINIEQIAKFFTEECLQNFLKITTGFANYYLHLLIRDHEDGLKQRIPFQNITICEIEEFLLKALAKYKNSTDATVCCMKISYFSKTSHEFRLNYVKDNYELAFNSKLKQLINSILQYPENSSDKQIEEMFLKMQVFILTNYQIGYPENHILLKQCRQSLDSILGKGDMHKYVLKKRHHRLEYLQKLGATAAGIIIFNNQGPEADKENVRNIFADLEMAKCNTKESLQESSDHVNHLKQKALKVLHELVQIDVQQRNICYFHPFNQIQELNRFVVLYEVYRTFLEKTKFFFEKTNYLIDVDQKKFYCVVEKISEILRYRSAIEAEKIFPHFICLSEIWKSLILYLSHLAEINKIKDHVDDMLSEELENKFSDILDNLSDKSKYLKDPVKYSFQDIIDSTLERKSNFNIMLNIKAPLKEYCALTMALTGGFLMPSQLEKKLCENVDFSFGFSNMEYAKFAERNFKDFIKMFRVNILKFSDLIVLFELDEAVIKQDIDLVQRTKAEKTSVQTQTEMISNNKTLRNPIHENWNVWNFHRQTIKLTNIRRKQTTAMQSNLSYGLRNAHNQCEIKQSN